MRSKDLALLIIFLFLAIVLAYAFRYLSVQSGHETGPVSGHKIVIVAPSGNLSAEYENTLVQSVEGIVGELSFLTGGKVSGDMIQVVTYKDIPSAGNGENSFIIFTKGAENKVVVFPDNKTIILEYTSSKGLAAVSDRLLIEMARNLVLGVDSKREYLVLVHPVKGNKVGIVWIGGLSLTQVEKIPVAYSGEKLSQRALIEMISGVKVEW